eukprot:UN00682
MIHAITNLSSSVSHLKTVTFIALATKLVKIKLFIVHQMEIVSFNVVQIIKTIQMLVNKLFLQAKQTLTCST